MNARLAVVSLWAEDVPACAHFYRDVIGLRLLPHHHGGRPHFDLGGVVLTILQGKPHPPKNPRPERFPVIAFAVGNLEEAIAQLENDAVELPWGVEVDAGAKWVMVLDPAGNLIEVAEFNRSPGQ